MAVNELEPVSDIEFNPSTGVGRDKDGGLTSVSTLSGVVMDDTQFCGNVDGYCGLCSEVAWDSVHIAPQNAFLDCNRFSHEKLRECSHAEVELECYSAFSHAGMLRAMSSF